MAYYKSLYELKHPDKYEGDKNKIIARSSWERRFFNWCDTNSSVVKWSSEETIVWYISPLDGRKHRYFVDAKIQVKDVNGNTQTYLIEIKPKAQTLPPVIPKRKTRRYLIEASTYCVNQAKFKAAEEYCKQRGWKFQILTEYELGIK